MDNKAKPITITIPCDLVDEVDRIRGAITRSRFISYLLEKSIRQIKQKGTTEGVIT